jgi:hypothetical protein
MIQLLAEQEVDTLKDIISRDLPWASYELLNCSINCLLGNKVYLVSVCKCTLTSYLLINILYPRIIKI